MNAMFESTGHLYYLINDVDLRNNDIVDMFKNASKYNFDSIITETHMEDSKIYLHFEQEGEIIEPKTSENKKQYQQQHQQVFHEDIQWLHIGKHTHNIKAAIHELIMKINRDVPQTSADKNNFEIMLNNTENLYNTNNNADFIYVRNNSIHNLLIYQIIQQVKLI